MTQSGWNLVSSVWRKTENRTTISTSFTLIVKATNIERAKAADIIKDQLANVGISITVRKVSDAQYQDYLNSKNYDMILMGTQTGFSPSIETYMGAGNFSKYNNSEVNGILRRSKKYF